MRNETKTKVWFSFVERNDEGNIKLDESGEPKRKRAIAEEENFDKRVQKERNMQVEAAKAAGTFDPSGIFIYDESILPMVINKGTFGYRFAENVDEAVDLSGGKVVVSGQYENIDVFLVRFNYGISLAQDNEANDCLQDEAWVTPDGIFPVWDAVKEKAERARLTPDEKLARDLRKAGYGDVSPDMLAAALRYIREQAAAPAA